MFDLYIMGVTRGLPPGERSFRQREAIGYHTGWIYWNKRSRKTVALSRRATVRICMQVVVMRTKTGGNSEISRTSK